MGRTLYPAPIGLPVYHSVQALLLTTPRHMGLATWLSSPFEEDACLLGGDTPVGLMHSAAAMLPQNVRCAVSPRTGVGRALDPRRAFAYFSPGFVICG
jgi:hypothetical protein